MANSRHLSVDARLAGPRHAGIGRYTAEILTRLLKQTKIGHGAKISPLMWDIWLDQNDDASWLPNSLPEHVEIHRTKVRHYSLREQVQWPGQLRSVPSDLLWVPHFNVPLNCPFPWVVTIHDLLWHQQRQASATTLPAWQHSVKHWGYRVVSAHAVRQAEAVLVPTHVVAEEIHSRFGKHVAVEVTSEGVTEAYLAAGLAKRDISSTKILVVGSLYPHKNIEVVLRALLRLPNFSLEIASVRSVFTERVLRQAKSLGVEKRIKFLGYVSDEEIKRNAGQYTALIQPSLSEGFGLTGLEGMALGIPVVCSALPVFAEVYGKYAQTFSPHDDSKLAAVIGDLFQNPPSLATLRAAQAHAREFTWDRAADKTWDVLQDAWKARYGNL